VEEYEVSLADYIRVLWKEKWVVIATFLVAVGTALIISFSQPRQYQVQTALLILPPLFQEVGGQLSGTVLSPETYRRLALANDLLERTLQQVYPEGSTLTVERLRESMKVEIEQTTTISKELAFPARFPLYMRVTFTGSDRKNLVRLAETWALTFVAQNTELFMTRTAQSLEYLEQSFREVERELHEKQEALKVFLQENPETVIQAEVDALKAKYADYLKSLADVERQLAASGARLSALREALEREPQYFVVERGPSNEALWQFLGARPEAKTLEAYARLTISDQILNSTYVGLRGQVASAEAEFASLKAAADYYNEALDRISAELAQKQAKLTEVQIRRQQMEQEIAVLQDTYNRVAKSLQDAKIARAETAEPIKIVERPVLPTTPVGPSRKLNVAVAGVLGLFLGVLLAFVVHYLQESSKAPHGQEPGQPPQEPRQE